MTRYKVITKHGHPNAQGRGTIFEHVFVMSEMLGRPLTALEVVHHKDKNKKNNHPDNLQLFATDALHQRHHAEERALEACGDRLFMKCPYCKEYDAPSNLVLRKTRYEGYHKSCVSLNNAKDKIAKAARRATPEGRVKANAPRQTPEGKAKANAASAKYRAKRKLSQQSIGI